jgi:predicted AAA+ superfamily ATPase
MYLPRISADRLRSLVRRFSAVAVLGPRQCGKTTLVRQLFPQAEWFDLERPSDVARLEADPEYTLRNLKAPVVLDEAHRMPQLFPILRALIDERRSANGRFLLLGSAHPSLVRDVSESLAGRIGFLDLYPLCYAEVPPRRVSLGDLWLRGGFPEPCLGLARRSPRDWMDGYIRTFLERDLAGLGVDVSVPQIRRFWNMLAYAHGTIWNASELGRALGLTYHTVNRYADILEHAFLLRRLPPYFVNLPKRMVKSPKVYLTDTGLLHAFLGIEGSRQLDVSPQRGASWEGFIIEQIIRRERLAHPASQFYFWRTATGVEVDLIVERGAQRIGVEIKSGSRIDLADLKNLRSAIEDLRLTRAWLVNQSGRRYAAAPGIQVIPARELLEDRWIL